MYNTVHNLQKDIISIKTMSKKYIIKEKQIVNDLDTIIALDTIILPKRQ